DLAGGGGTGRLGEQMVDAVFAADPVKEHVDGRFRVFAGEDLAVVGEHLLRHTVPAERGQEAIANQLSSLARHEPRRHTEPGMVVDAGQSLGRGAVREEEAAHYVEL